MTMRPISYQDTTYNPPPANPLTQGQIVYVNPPTGHTTPAVSRPARIGAILLTGGIVTVGALAGIVWWMSPVQQLERTQAELARTQAAIAEFQQQKKQFCEGQ